MNPLSSEEKEQGRALFNNWCGNSYEWDALTNLEQERWNALATRLKAESDALRERVKELQATVHRQAGDLIIETRKLSALQQKLADSEARVATLEDMLKPLDPNGFGDGGAEVIREFFASKDKALVAEIQARRLAKKQALAELKKGAG